MKSETKELLLLLLEEQLAHVEAENHTAMNRFLANRLSAAKKDLELDINAGTKPVEIPPLNEKPKKKRGPYKTKSHDEIVATRTPIINPRSMDVAAITEIISNRYRKEKDALIELSLLSQMIAILRRFESDEKVSYKQLQAVLRINDEEFAVLIDLMVTLRLLYRFSRWVYVLGSQIATCFK